MALEVTFGKEARAGGRETMTKHKSLSDFKQSLGLGLSQSTLPHNSLLPSPEPRGHTLGTALTRDAAGLVLFSTSNFMVTMLAFFSHCLYLQSTLSLVCVIEH